MASGKKNYFRHSFNAFEDDKIQSVIESLGYEGYAYYFILIELLAKQCENEIKNPITIHIQTLRIVWRKHTKSCIKVVEKLHKSGLFVATFKESSIEFDIPNLSKYMGKYTNKITPNTPNKRKEKKRKEKINNDDIKKFDIEKIYLEYPKKQGKAGGIKKLQAIIKTQDIYDKIIQGAINYRNQCFDQNTEQKYIKQFSTWVNGEYWEDEIENKSLVQKRIEQLEQEIINGI